MSKRVAWYSKNSRGLHHGAQLAKAATYPAGGPVYLEHWNGLLQGKAQTAEMKSTGANSSLPAQIAWMVGSKSATVTTDCKDGRH